MKIIGSRQAARLAAQKFGTGMYAKRIGREFEIGKKLGSLASMRLDLVYGRGESWADALRDAGITIPDSTDDLYPEFKDKKEKK